MLGHMCAFTLSNLGYKLRRLDEGERRGQLRVGAADLQCGVAVETVDSQNPSSYTDHILRLCACSYMRDCVGCVRARREQRGEG